MAAKIRFYVAGVERGVEDGVMSVFLLLLGVVTTAAGLALVASGATADTDIITPGTIAAVGGLVLVGIGLVVRELQRIEQALSPHTWAKRPPSSRPNRQRAFPFRPSQRRIRSRSRLSLTHLRYRLRLNRCPPTRRRLRPPHRQPPLLRRRRPRMVRLNACEQSSRLWHGLKMARLLIGPRFRWSRSRQLLRKETWAR